MRQTRAGRCDSGSRRHHDRRDGGFTTAETAVALPALMMLLLVVAVLLGLLLDQIRCVDAARIAARAVARGDAVVVVERRALEAAPDGASVTISKGSRVRVVVTGPDRSFGTDRLRARAAATAPDESIGVSGRRLGAQPVDPASLPVETG